MMKFEPIAIVGRGCVLPGHAFDPDTLWTIIAEKQSVISRPPAGYWGVLPEQENDYPYKAGFVTGFEAVFDPERHRLDNIDVSALDAVFQWSLHAGRAAWDEASAAMNGIAPHRIGVLLANLSYPSRGKADYASSIWLGQPVTTDPLNYFNSGLPAEILARSIGAAGPAYALDAACASSLYAVHTACRALQAGTLDAALVAAVNGADNLLLQMGFDALQALSPTGRSRPFVEGADGLVPSEGAVALVLKRLCDVEPGERVFGVIRATGLSNDGRRRGFLAPDADGQSEAMARAYSESSIDPASIQYLECHATGTPGGDGVEVRSAAHIFGDRGPLPVGSLKSNLGHLITAAGLASLLKMMSAFEEESLPPMRLDGAVLGALSGTALVPQTELAPWRSDGPRRAAISNFGFGGNNAHLILDAPTRMPSQPALAAVVRSVEQQDDIVVCGVGLIAGPDRGASAVLRRLMNQPIKPAEACETLIADPLRARTPPSDLKAAEPAHLAILDVADEALEGVVKPSAERCGAFVGMGCTANSTRWLLKARLAILTGLKAGSRDLAEAEEKIIAPMQAPDVLGAMPNLLANRLSLALDCRGETLTLSAEGASGPAALSAAIGALRAGDLDLAIVAGADFAGETIAKAAWGQLGLAGKAGDAAGALVLKRRRDAETAGDRILAVLDTSVDTTKGGAAEPGREAIMTAYGRAPVAEGVTWVAAHIMAASRGLTLTKTGAEPDLTSVPDPLIQIPIKSGFGACWQIDIRPCVRQPSPDPLRVTPILYWARAKTRKALIKRLQAGKCGGKGEVRFAAVARDENTLVAVRADAANALERDEIPKGTDVWFGEGSPVGEMAFVFTGSAASYPRMGRGLFAGLPALGPALVQAFPRAGEMAHLLSLSSLGEFDQLCAVTLLTHAHALTLRDVLGLQPDAALGLSLGETNALYAFAFWQDPGALLDEIAEAAMYDRHLGGAFETASAAWGREGPASWGNWRIYAPLTAVRAVIAKVENVEITIIYTDEDCVIGGPPDACRFVAEQLGPGAGMALGQNLIVHAKAMAPFAETWRKLHTRRTSGKPEIRLYSNAFGRAYKPTRKSVGDALTAQAVATVDFPRTVRQAYADGVRTFVELGPRDTLSESIGKILGDLPHLAVAADRVERSDLDQLARLGGALFAEGRQISLKALSAILNAAQDNSWPVRRTSKTALRHLVKEAVFEVPDGTCRAKEVPCARLRQPPSRPPPDYPQSCPPSPISGLFALTVPPLAEQTSPPKAVLSGMKALDQRPAMGPDFPRAAIAAAATGPISDLFGALFKPQDGYRRQVRLPAPPLLLVDRITGIDAEAGIEGKGVIWTETDVDGDAWYMSGGYMRPGPLIEAGQADLSLISWMGADLQNRDERVYRLLGCEITYHPGGMPKAGETLRYQIEITGHAAVSGVRMFFFQYDCRIGNRRVFSVRQGQAGFFTDAELANASGVVWDAATHAPPTLNPSAFTPKRVSTKRTFSFDDVTAWRDGDSYACFGSGFEAAAAHTNPPPVPQGNMALFDSVEVFDPTGGPWGRGYLRAVACAPTDAWFYNGHFHNDPCMPGTLMAEAAVQALEFYTAAVGLTLEQDGFVFEPIPGVPAKFICRGQVIPDKDHKITYEVFIDEIVEGDTPEIYATLLARSDGKKVFHCHRFGVRLRRDWAPARTHIRPVHIGPMGESRGDYGALLACGDGAPSDAFGEMYAPFDTSGRVPRLPQPPYHFISRIIDITTRPNAPEVGATVTTEYDPPLDAWYFSDGGNGAMPYAVLVEVVLQPCGWLASHGGFALTGGERFRNLDGDGVVLREIRPGDGPVRVVSTLTGFSKAGPMTIVTFELTATLPGGELVMTLETSFGFFPTAALERQAGLKTSEADHAYLALPESNVAVADPSGVLPTGRLPMLDGVDYWDPTGGVAGLGLIRGQQAIDPYAWYFKAHFYQDPVQPGSLGLDALAQLLMRAALLKGYGQGIERGTPLVSPRIQSVAVGERTAWSYRGQVTPEKQRVTTVIEVIEIKDTGPDVMLRARGSLWCDGLRIYEAKSFAIRVMG